MVLNEHAPLAQLDTKVHRGAEQDALQAEVSAPGVKERAVLVQEQKGEVQETEDVAVRAGVARTLLPPGTSSRYGREEACVS